MNEEDVYTENEISACDMIYKTILSGILLLPLVMYGIYPPMRDDPLLLLGIPLFCLFLFVWSCTQKRRCKNVGGKNG